MLAKHAGKSPGDLQLLGARDGIEPSLFALACAGSTLVGVLAAVVPARRAAQLDPAVAIRG